MLTSARSGRRSQAESKGIMTKSALQSFLHPLSLVRALWKHRPLVLVVSIVIGGVAIAVVHHLPDIYQAESLVLVDAQKIPERFVAATVQVSLQDHLAMISQQILSATQLERLIKKYDLYSELRSTRSPEQIVEQMRKDIKIPLERGWGSGRSGAFRVVYQGPDPQVVANVVNEISGMFIAENLRARELRAEGTSEFIESQLAEARKNLEEQEATYSRFKLERMGELPEQESALTGTLNRLQAELQGAQDAINRAEQGKLVAENTLRVAEAAEAMAVRAIRDATTPVSAPGGMRQEPATAVGTPAPTTRSQVLRRQLEQLQARYQDEHPEVRRAKFELEAALKQEALETGAASQRRPAQTALAANSGTPAGAEDLGTASTPPQLRADLNRERERVAASRVQLELSKKELEARVADRRRILQSIAEYQRKLERLPVREQELASITRDYENSKQNYRSLMDKKASAVMAAEMERRQQSERFTLQDPARVPTKPIRPRRPLYYSGGVLAALVLGVMAALVLEFRRNQLLGEWELPPGVNILGRIPMIDSKDASNLRRSGATVVASTGMLVTILGVLANV